MGKEKKQKSIGRLLIDLTPLLDVIFIVLIVVLAGQDNYNSEADKKYAEAEQYVNTAEEKIADMEAQNVTYSQQMKAYEDINEFFNVITVYAGYSHENRKYRTIYVMINNNAPVEISLNPSREEEAWSECRKMIDDVISEDDSLPVILSIAKERDDKMLYRDEESILKIFNDFRNKYTKTNIIIK
ncbi:MAG: hypothetical protein IKP88_10525 [Lachnospiraceae bacterium]|nr:hypothetical protein [Lachnospiraceae bacterium]